MNKLKIGLDSTWWDKAPHSRIYLNNDMLFDDKVEQAKLLEFKFQNLDCTRCQLRVELVGKTVDQTLVDGDNRILKDQLLKIEKIEIDEIDLGLLIFTKGLYYPDYPIHLHNQNLPSAMSADTFGFNGYWVLEFDLPFTFWYLENLP